MNRREFIQAGLSALGFSALPGGLLFAAPKGWKHDGTPNLVFGVLSDTHLRTRVHGNKLGANWTNRYFISALEYFKTRRVDAVAHCGDFAHRGQNRDMEFHAEAWRKVFANGTEPVKLFVTGNHDTDGATYGDFVAKRYPDPVERAKHVLSTDMAANWERIWGEKYESVWHKEVKGYHFFGQNFSVPDDEAIAYLKKYDATFMLGQWDKPCFFVRHRRPNANIRKKALLPLRNAIAFFGHNHWSVTNWNVPSLYYGRLPVLQCASCEPRGCRALVGDGYISKAKIEGRDAVGSARQGYVILVYDDMMVIERHEFTKGESSLGPDWVMPFGREGERVKRAHSFSRGELKKVIGDPQFREGAKLEIVVEGTKRTEGTKATSLKENKSVLPSLLVNIPLADGNPKSRIYAYEVEVTGRQTEVHLDTRSPRLLKAVYAAGVNMGIGHEPNGGITTLEIAKSELPPGSTLTFTVHPLSSLGTRGRPIVEEFKVWEKSNAPQSQRSMYTDL